MNNLENKNYIDYEKVKLMLEGAEKDNYFPDLAGLQNSAKYAPSNRFTLNPTSFVIEDTVNNICFPIESPILDKGQGYLGIIYKQLVARYTKQLSGGVLPWHYLVQFNKYTASYEVLNTRPINLRYPFTSNQVKEIIEINDIEIDDDTKELLDVENLNISEMIHICIVGNSRIDVYPRSIYSTISQTIISPLCKLFRINPIVGEGIYFLNMQDSKFNGQMLGQYIKRL
ncbi:MAG: hypothetical protein H7836_12385 [Magnetococcus sp. YQC-3]